MMRKKQLLLSAAFGLAAAGLVACGDDSIEDDMEDAADDMEDAADDVGDDIEDAADDTGDAMEDAADDVEDEVDDDPMQ